MTVEIDIAYNDNFIEVYTAEMAELKYILKELATDTDKIFRTGDNIFYKKDINSVSIGDQGLGFIFADVTD